MGSVEGLGPGVLSASLSSIPPRKHLSVRRFKWWIRFIVINTLLFFLFFFLTTPAIIINTIDMYNVTRPLEKLQVPPLLRPAWGAREVKEEPRGGWNGGPTGTWIQSPCTSTLVEVASG